MIWGSNISKEDAHSTAHGMKEAMPVYVDSGETALSGGRGIRTEKKMLRRKQSADGFKGQEEDKRERQGHTKTVREPGGGHVYP